MQKYGFFSALARAKDLGIFSLNFTCKTLAREKIGPFLLCIPQRAKECRSRAKKNLKSGCFLFFRVFFAEKKVYRCFIGESTRNISVFFLGIYAGPSPRTCCDGDGYKSNFELVPDFVFWVWVVTEVVYNVFSPDFSDLSNLNRRCVFKSCQARLVIRTILKMCVFWGLPGAEFGARYETWCVR